jgi:ABC-type multidrug transport system fused ATPase/permease subunit
MMRWLFDGAFWRLTRDLPRVRRLVASSMIGSIVAAACFGAGLSMLLPLVALLLNSRQSLPQLILAQTQGWPEGPLRRVAFWLADQLPSDAFAGFVCVIAAVTALSLIGGLSRYSHTMAVYRAVQRASTAWRRRLFRQTLRSPLSATMYHSVGDQMTRIMQDANQIAAAFRMLLGTTVNKLFNGVAALAAAMWLNLELTLIGMVGAPAIGLIIALVGGRIRAVSRRSLKRRGELGGRLRETLQHAQVIKANQAEGVEMRRFRLLSSEAERDEMSARRLDALSKPVIEVVLVAGLGAAACLAAHQVLRRDVAASEFVTVLAMLAAAGVTFQRGIGLINHFQEIMPVAHRMIEAFDQATEERADRLARRPWLPPHRRSIVMESVSYAYPGQQTSALREVCLEVRHGQTTAVVGPNGSGKTTLIRLLARLLDPDSGRVLIDGVDLAQVDRRSVRRQIALVTQETVLFRGSIARNIAYGRPHADRDQIQAAAQAAMAHDFIARLPQGLDTELADEGAGLSGGEKQRLCLARAILRDPAILILDEATSQIDAESEAKISRVLRDFRHGRTTFIIAHRLSTVVDADVIIVMDAGRVIDLGSHDQLLARCPLYHQLVHRQMIVAAQPTHTG